MNSPRLEGLLADIQGAEKAKDLRRGVPVLEEVEVGAASVLHLEGDSLASRAGERRDNIRVARGYSDSAKVLGDGGSVLETCRFLGNGGELGEVNLAITAEAIRRSLKILELREQEHETAGFVGVGGGDVEVENS
jgi:hypothetical protein